MCAERIRKQLKRKALEWAAHSKLDQTGGVRMAAHSKLVRRATFLNRRGCFEWASIRNACSGTANGSNGRRWNGSPFETGSNGRRSNGSPFEVPRVAFQNRRSSFEWASIRNACRGSCKWIKRKALEWAAHECAAHSKHKRRMEARHFNDMVTVCVVMLQACERVSLFCVCECVCVCRMCVRVCLVWCLCVSTCV